MVSFKKNLVLRITVAVVLMTLTLGTFLYFFVLDTISDFAENDIERDLSSLSHRLYNICNLNYDKVLQSGAADDPTKLIIIQALTLGEFEDFFRQESIQGLVYSSLEKKYLTKTELPAPPDTILQEISPQGVLISLSGEAEGNFGFQFDFTPWSWQIVIIKSETEYGMLIDRVKGAYLYTLLPLLAATVLLVFFFYRSILKPINAIVNPLQFAKKPSYKGIEVFEYLSRTIGDMMDYIKQSELKFRYFVETSTDFVWEVDKNATLTYASPIIKRMLGYDVEEMIGKSLFSLMDEEEQNVAYKSFKRLASFGAPIDQEIHAYLHKNGSQIFIERNGVPIFDDSGNVTGYHGIDRDITERLLAEKKHKEYEVQQQLIKLESLGTLAGGIAHDFNNILSIIQGNISLAQISISSKEDALKYLNQTLLALKRAEQLTSKLITFSKGGAPSREAASIRTLLIDTVSEMRVTPDIHCKFSFPEDLLMVDVDQRQMKQALENIILNGIESMPQGGSLHFKGENLEIDSSDVLYPNLSPGKYVKICIEDSGVGIDLDHINKIFDPYFSTKQMGVQKGMGLGLTVSYSIIQRHNGHIEVDSKQEKGSSFTLLIPAYTGKIQKPPKKVHESKPPEHYQVKRILIMDDEEMLRTLILTMLKNLGYEAQAAKDGLEALTIYEREMLNECPFDLVILDLTVKGGMSGMEAIGKLLEIDPDVKAIVSSGYSNDPVINTPEQYGFIATLPKPYEIKQLKETIKEVERSSK